jgi:inositol-phosphate phosphatase/L-galactose 1-phosphate phosphatase/histidinol-phosphatase
MVIEVSQSLLHQWVEQAGELILSMSQRAVAGHLKADASPVTEIDLAVEHFLRDQMMRYFPADGIIGEELPAHQPEAAAQWLIDPIDGTRALMAGFSSYTILLAYLRKGLPQASAIYQPVTREFWFGDAMAGQAWCNQKRIRTRDCQTLSAAFFSTTSPLLFREQDQPLIQQLMQECKAYQLGGDAYAYAKLASGYIDVIVESGLKPHDFMALIPVIQGAGGVITDWQGNALTLNSKGDVCAAATPVLHREIINRLEQA